MYPDDIAKLARLGVNKGLLDKIMLTMCHHNRTFATCDSSILDRQLYKESQAGTPYWDVGRKYFLVLKSCVGTRMKQLQSKVCGYQPQP